MNTFKKLLKTVKTYFKIPTSLLNTDNFISSLWKIYQKSISSGFQQDIYFSVTRVDYMLHKKTENSSTEIKQVEINTMAAGMGYGSTKVQKLHTQVLKWLGYDDLLPKVIE